jgi:hypothetical protein
MRGAPACGRAGRVLVPHGTSQAGRGQNGLLSAPPAPEPPAVQVEAESAWSKLHRYFFYAWLFSDADSGSVWERSAARRRNGEQAKWLPTYLLRWSVVGCLLATLEQMSERLRGSSTLSAALAVCVILVVTFCLVTAVCWAFLRGSRGTH